MNLKLIGHDDRYAVEQLLLSLFPEDAEPEAVSALHRGATWLTATARITLGGRTAKASRRLRSGEETVRLRRRYCSRAFIWLPGSFWIGSLPGAPWPVYGPPS